MSSPFFRLERRRDLAQLLGTDQRRLQALVNDREQHYVFRSEQVGSKIRKLAIPVRCLRRCHERIFRLLKRIELPDHVRCPRKGSSPIQNALAHAGNGSITCADVKDFYPATNEEHVFRFFKYKAQMSDDCARLLARLCTVDDSLPIGSPVSPHLACLVHLDLFERAAERADATGNRLTVWVDDITYSGRTHRRDIMSALRQNAKSKGFDLHKVQRGGGKRTVEVTGTAIRGGRSDVANGGNLKLKSLLADFRSEKEQSVKVALANQILGVLRYHRQLRRSSGRRTERDEARIRWVKRQLEEVTCVLHQRAAFKEDGSHVGIAAGDPF